MSTLSSILDNINERFGSNDPAFFVVAVTTAILAAVVSFPFGVNVLKRLANGIRLEWVLFIRRHGQKTGSSADVEPPMAVVTSLFVHPVKSMRAVALQETTLDIKGMTNDRRFMVVYELPLPPWKKPGEGWTPTEVSHRFLTQRQCPSLATIVATFETIDDTQGGGGRQSLVLTNTKTNASKKKNVVVIPISNESPQSSQVYRAGIWDDTVLVEDLGDEAAKFLKELVDADEECTISTTSTTSSTGSSPSSSSIRLVRHNIPDRAVDSTYLPNCARTWLGSSPLVSLTDGFPILIASETSLDEVNTRLQSNGKDPIPMSRFRPNIVIGSATPNNKNNKKNNRKSLPPFAEDRWKIISIGEQLFAIVKACPRCKQSCTDQLTGVVSTEPVETLKSFRQLGDKGAEDVFFAQNAVPIFRPGQDRNYKLRVGDPLRVIEWGDPIYK